MKTLSTTAFVVCIVVPAVAALALSAVYASGYFHADHPSIASFAQMAHSSRFLKALGYTLTLALAVVAVSTLLALRLTKLLNRRMHMSTWFLLPFAIPPVVAAFFSFHLFSGSGFLSRIAYAAGFTTSPVDFPALVNDSFGIGTFITHCMLTFPFFLVYFIYLRSDERLEQLARTARTLGASDQQVWKYVLRPALLHKSAPLLLVFFVFVVGTYEIPLLLGSQSVRAMVPVIVDQIKGYNLKGIPVGYAMALTYGLIIMLVAGVLARTMNRQYGT